MPDPQNPFNPARGAGGFHRARTLTDALIDAHGRKLNALAEERGAKDAQSMGRIREQLPFNAFVDNVIRELEGGGNDDRAKAIRDWRSQRQGGLLTARSEEAFLRQAQAEGRLPSGLGIMAQRLNPFGGPAGLGTREEQVERAHEGSTLLRDAERLAYQGIEGFADVASLGTKDLLTQKVTELRQATGTMPEIGGRNILAGMSASDIVDRGEQAAADDLDESGVPPWLRHGFRAAGELVGFFTPAGYISRAGNVLKIARAGKFGNRAFQVLGRALQNPIINFAATEALVTEGEIQSARARGLGDRADELRAGQGARIANAGAFAAFAPIARTFGRLGQNGLLRLTGSSAANAKLANATLSQLPSLWQKARAVGSHVTGKMGEFIAFGFVPNVYTTNREGQTEMSPWFTTILNPKVVAGAIGGDKAARGAWADAMTEVLHNGVEHTKQGGVTGGILGILTAGKARLGDRLDRPGSHGRGFKELVTLGPRTLTDPRAQAELEGRAAREINLRALREVRKDMTPEQRKAFKEALLTELENHSNPEEFIQDSISFVAAAAEQQRRVLQANGALPKDMPTIADDVRRFWEDRLGTELFEGRAKDTTSPSLGVEFELVADPDRPNQPGRKGEVLEYFETSPPDLQGVPDPARRKARLARVRYEDGTIGVVDADTLRITGTPQAPAPAPAEGPGPGGSGAGKGEAARKRGVQGTLGRVTDRETGAVGELVRAHTDADGRRLVDVKIGGELRTFDADRFEIRDPNVILQETEVGRAPGAGTDRVGKGRAERTAEDLERGDVKPKSIQAGSDRMAKKGGTGFLDRLRRRFNLTETEAFHEEGRQIQEGRLSEEDATTHQQRVIEKWYEPGERVQRGRGGKLVPSYRSLRRRFLEGKGDVAPRKLLGRMKATWDALTEAERARVLEGTETFLPHEKPGHGLSEVLRALGEESRFLKAPEKPSEPSEVAPDADATREGEARERAAEGQETPPERQRRRQGDVPLEETAQQRKLRRLRSVAKGRKKQAFTDSMTGLPNKAARERSQIRADAEGDHTLLADLQGLKAANAGPEGQLGGDRLIREQSARFAELAEKAGLTRRRVFREGGDEFAAHGTPEQVAEFKRLLEAEGGWHVSTAKDMTLASEALPGVKEANREKAPEKPAEEKPKPTVVEPPEDRKEPDRPEEVAPIPESVPEGDVARGKYVEIRQEGTTERVSAEYATVPLDSLLPSHDKNFKPNEGYPEGLQPRDYENDTFERDKVERIARQFDPIEVVNTSPRADAGPPTAAYDPATKKFVVLNGNARGMGMQRALTDTETAARYAEAIGEQATSFDLGSEVPAGHALVRLAHLNPHGDAAREFARRGNLPGAQRQKPIDRAAAESGMLTDTILQDLSREPGTTVAGAINGDAGRSFRQALRHRLGSSGNDLFNEDGTFTDAGKEFAEGMLALRAGFTPTDLRGFSPAIRRTAAASTMQFLELRRNPKTKMEAGILRDSLRFVSSELEGGRLTLQDWEAQASMFEREGPRTPAHRVAIEALQSTINKPKVTRDALAKLVSKEHDAPGQQMLVRNDPLPFVDRVAEAFGLDVPEHVRAGASEVEESAAMGMPDPRNPMRRHELLPEQRESSMPPDPISGADQKATDLSLPLERDARPEFAEAPAMPAAEVVQKVRDLFSVPIIVGRTGDSRAAFDNRGRVIRLRRANDLVGIAHEVGHGLEKYLERNLPASQEGRRIRDEIVRLGRELYPEKPPWNGWASEGWGEFVRLWLTNPKALKAKAGRAAKWFDKNVDFEGEGWRQKLQEVRQFYDQFVGQGSAKRVEAFRSGKSKQPTALQELKPSNLSQKWVDQGAPILKLVRKLEKAGVQIPFEANPAIAREALDNSHHAKARLMAEDGMIDFAGNRTGPSLADAVNLVGRDRYGDVVDYLVAKQAATINARGKTSGLSDTDIQATLDRFATDHKVQRAAQIVWDWHRGVLEYMKQAGALTQGEVSAMVEAYPFYIPFQRVKGKAGGGGFGGPSGGPKRLKGSGREIINPIDASVAQTANFLRWAHSKNMQLRLANLADLVPGLGRHVRLADPATVRRAKPLENFEAELRDAGINTEGLGESKVLDWLEARTTEEGDVLFGVKRGDKPGEFKPNVVWYEASPEFYKAASSADIHRFGPVMDLLVGRPARLKRLGTTGLRPGFAAVNLVRDYFVGLMQSSTRNPLSWTYHWAAGQGSALKALFGKQDSWYRMYRALGVEMARQLSLDKAVREKLGANLGTTALERVGSDLKHFRALRLAERGIDGLRDLIGVAEAGPRIAEMRILAKKLGIDPRQPLTLENAMRLARGGRQVSVDFNAAGTEGRKWNAAIPFFNVAIQGPRRMIEAFNRDRIGFALKAMASITVPTLLLWDQNKDEDWYVDMPWWEKYSYWHVGDGIRIPRPFEIGTIFATFPEAAMDADYHKNPRALMEALSAAKEQVTPDVLPVLAREARDWLANEDSFTNAPIVPRIEEDLAEEEQFGPRTTNVARHIGSALGVSPRKIDHAIRGIGGGVFEDVARTGGTVGGGEDRFRLNPLERFRRRGGQQGAASQAVQDFFDLRTELQKQVRSRVEPATPRQRRALRILERAAKRLKALRGTRAGLSGEGPLGENLKEMREEARKAIERANRILEQG